MAYLSDVAIVTVCQHPTFLVPLLRIYLWSLFSSDAKKCQHSVVVAGVLGTIEDGASCSDKATNDDRRSVVVTGSVKAAGACSGDGVG